MSNDILGCGVLLHPFASNIAEPGQGSNGRVDRHERRLRKAAEAARYFQVSPTTIENWLHRAYIRAYRVEGNRSLMYDLDEIERAFKMHGPDKMRDGRRRGAGHVVPLTVVASEGEK